MGNKVYGEFTVKFWADADEYAAEYEPTADVLQAARNDFESAILSLGESVSWRGARVVEPERPVLMMTDAARRTAMRAYNDWRAERSVLGFREESDGDQPDSGDWHANDDSAKDLYGDLATFLFDTDDCGHQEVTVARSEEGSGVYTVTCDNCPDRWVVRDGHVPRVRTFANGFGEWRAVVTQYGVGDAQEAMTDAYAAIRRELIERGTDPEAIKARMTVERMGRVSRNGTLETKFKEVWADQA